MFLNPSKNRATAVKAVEQRQGLPRYGSFKKTNKTTTKKNINKICPLLKTGLLHLGVCGVTSNPVKRTFSCGICTSSKGCKPKASCCETEEAAEKPNLASEIRSVDKRWGSTEPARHPDPVIFDQAGHVPLRLHTLPHLLCLLAPNTSHPVPGISAPLL